MQVFCNFFAETLRFSYLFPGSPVPPLPAWQYRDSKSAVSCLPGGFLCGMIIPETARNGNPAAARLRSHRAGAADGLQAGSHSRFHQHIEGVISDENPVSRSFWPAAHLLHGDGRSRTAHRKLSAIGFLITDSAAFKMPGGLQTALPQKEKSHSKSDGIFLFADKQSVVLLWSPFMSMLTIVSANRFRRTLLKISPNPLLLKKLPISPCVVSQGIPSPKWFCGNCIRGCPLMVGKIILRQPLIIFGGTLLRQPPLAQR